MSKVMAKEFLPLKIRVNQIAVCRLGFILCAVTYTPQPGIFPSEMTAQDSDEHTHKSDLSGTGKGEGLPAGRPGDEKDMAAAILYLASYAGVLFVLFPCPYLGVC
jgi:NAD(P)-dependent dehydrogenase (short-subunit alcohol dehydrogenase family)